MPTTATDATQFDAIERPRHYLEGIDPAYEPIKIVEAWDLCHHLATAVVYILRAGRKGTAIEDLKKARWYLSRRITNLEAAESACTRVHTIFDQPEGTNEA